MLKYETGCCRLPLIIPGSRFRVALRMPAVPTLAEDGMQQQPGPVPIGAWVAQKIPFSCLVAIGTVLFQSAPVFRVPVPASHGGTSARCHPLHGQIADALQEPDLIGAENFAP